MEENEIPASHSDKDREINVTRRVFITAVGRLGALLAVGSSVLAGETYGQPAPAAAGTSPQPAAPALPGPVVSNAAILAEKDPLMKVLTERPLTANVTAEHLNDPVTPSSRMFIRNNMLTPDLQAEGHTLTVRGLVETPLKLNLAELKKKFAAVTIQGMLECAGSGRTAFSPLPKGTPWNPSGGYGCPKWTGARLADILKAAGLRPDAVHVAFFGSDFGELATAPPVVRSIPISKALEPNTLVAWEMNGAPIPKVHGFPLRVVVPGWVGSASIKWLAGIEVLSAPFKGTYMDDSYRVPAYPIAPGEKMPKDTLSTEAWPVKSVITAPAQGAKFKLGDAIQISGKAWAGENRIEKVEISVDEGVTWKPAVLSSQGDRYAWRIFNFNVRPVQRGHMTLLARATDSAGNVQPISAVWNPLGYFWNGFHRVGITIEKT
ncbi:MAG: molybdopterin containing oxidoreductase [Thermodesulfovibrio sp.]|nr:molybdopterin containing oxidoreductase [Thermodesulfovibrio sp.]